MGIIAKHNTEPTTKKKNMFYLSLITIWLVFIVLAHIVCYGIKLIYIKLKK